MKVPNNNCGLRLRKGLYWLKQSPRIWNNQFKSTIERYGFKATISDSCIFFNEDKNILMAIYADDGLIFAKRQHEIEEVFSMLRENFDIRETTGSCFIGTKIERMSDGYFLQQSAYAKQVLKRFGMEYSKIVSTPLITKHDLTDIDQQEPKYECPFREAIGSLLYLATNTRPDILHPVTLLARFSNNPKEKHWLAVKRIFQYICGTLNFGLKFSRQGDFKMSAYTDAD